jgi:hypothetical protein
MAASLPALLFIPLDDRPVTRDAVLDLAAAAGVAVHTPERALLGGRRRGADVHAIWSWVHRQLEESPLPAACVASIEMLCFGGLVASRAGTRHWRNVLPLLDQVYALAQKVPAYLSAVIPRTPVHAGGNEDAAHWEMHGEALRAYSIAADQFGWMGDAGAARRVAEALERLPSGVIEAVLQHRRRHLLLNAELVIAAAGGPIRALLLGQDDTTAAGLSRIDREALERLARVAGAGNVLLTSGADELGGALFARWLTQTAPVRPAVRVVYTFPKAMDRVPAYESTPLAQTVREHIEAAGCRVVTAHEEILLWVHNFEEETQREARDQEDEPDGPGADAAERILSEAAAGPRLLALADVRYANGADRALVAAMLERKGILPDAYAGWNTASNTVGSVIAQAVAASHGRKSGGAAAEAAARRMLAARLLDDWGYQAVVRPRLHSELRGRGGDPAALGPHAPPLEAAARGVFVEAVLPPLAAALGPGLALRRVTFPWDRLFEAAIEFDLP